MMRELTGFDRVFRFTLIQHWKSKGFFRATVIVAVLCLLLPALIMTLVAALSDDSSATPDGSFTAPEVVLVVDETFAPNATATALEEVSTQTPLAATEYRMIEGGLQDAADEASAIESVLILYLTKMDESYRAQILRPEQTSVSRANAEIFTSFINLNLRYVIAVKMGIEPAAVSAMEMPTLSMPHIGGMVETENEEAFVDMPAPEEQTREILAMILPYFNIMILYFMVLFYGQGVANSVILEKTSKLVDTFLVTVRPGALVMGKMLAIAASGALQLLLWLASLIGGFAAGGVIVRWIEPNSQMGLLLFMDQLKLWGGAFSLPAVLIAVLMLCAGFLMYCALAAIGGSMASKPEELSSTNSLFSMVLVISFLCTIYAGGMDAGMSSAETWLNWVPFTAIFVVPARVLVGEVSVWVAVLSLLLVLAVSLLLVLAAGKAYRMLILYKGNTPKLRNVVKMLLSSKEK